MPSFTFIHAADLHLGAPFRGLDTAAAEALGPQKAGRLLSEASYTALERLEKLCLAEKADFLLLAGDVYDDEDGVLRARFALRDMCERLAKAGVRVFIAHGNHDPLPEGPDLLPWPEGVTVFGPKVQSEPVKRNGETLALVHGISHTGPKEKNNLAKFFSRKSPDLLSPEMTEGLFQIGLLHCCVGTVEGHAPYAPCSLTDLTGAGLDYWALGHVHQGRMLAAKPPVVYPGSLQGLHINESGPHGCVAVRVEDGVCRVREISLAPVQWHKLTLDLEGVENLDELEQAALEVLDEAARSVAGVGANGANDAAGEEAALFFAPTVLFCRLTLTGRTNLDKALRRPGELETVQARLRAAIAKNAADSSVPAVRLKDLVLRTAPALDFAALTKRDDLAGEVARLASQAETDAETLHALADGALDELYNHRRLKKVLTRPTDAELRDLAATARLMGCSLLESD